MYGTANERSQERPESETAPQERRVASNRRPSYEAAERSSRAMDRSSYETASAEPASIDRSRQQLRPQTNAEYSSSMDRSSYETSNADYDRSKQQMRPQSNSEYSFMDRSAYDAATVDYSKQQQQQQRPQSTIDYPTSFGTAKERTLPHSNPQPQQQPQPQHPPPKHNTEYVRKPQNYVLPPQMRPPVGPPQQRPPFAGARPMVGMGPRPPMPPPNMGARQMPPPLRNTESKSNLIMGPPQMRPGMPPQLSLQQPRPPNAGGPLSPPGQGPPRPPGGFPWTPSGAPPGMPPGARPPQNMTRPPPPTFARPAPGQPLQAPFRPTFNQQPMQQLQQQPPHQQAPPQQQQQQQQQQQPHIQQQPQPQPQPPPQLRPPSSMGAHNDDDDDVIMGPAVTPLKTFNMKADPMGSPLLEDTEPPFETSRSSAPAEAQRKGKGPALKGDNDSGVDESTQEKDRNGPISPSSPVKTPTSTSSKADKSGISRPPSATPSNKSASKSRSASKNRLLLKTPEPEPVKKVPMNKVQVGHAPSPNLKAVRSKIGSLDNATYKPGGGHVKIESKKVEIKAAPRIEAKNDKYMPKGGEKKIQTQKIEIKAQSKVGSWDNVKHRPGGGEKKIFDDKDYLKNVEHSAALTTPPTQFEAQGRLIATIHLEFGLCNSDCYWKAPRIQRATTLTSSMSLPAECLVLSVSMPSLNSEPKRPKSAGPKKKPSQAVHQKPFRLY
ncbi:basic proline-rich protein isoform X5 [Drosophila pseudoobscura]|uniref:Microtubule-associated protein n=1 Tax=Drosophila pseudoobscura pseudoobscura TaxID=46245 RepID=A0A6I8VNE1_DROPS|nr:basic proline-rich protein isoform X5 [Drosophila pseudoobscura]